MQIVLSHFFVDITSKENSKIAISSFYNGESSYNRCPPIADSAMNFEEN